MANHSNSTAANKETGQMASGKQARRVSKFYEAVERYAQQQGMNAKLRGDMVLVEFNEEPLFSARGDLADVLKRMAIREVSSDVDLLPTLNGFYVALRAR